MNHLCSCALTPQYGPHERSCPHYRMSPTPELLADLRASARRGDTVQLPPSVLLALLNRIEALETTLREMSPEALALAKSAARRWTDEDLRNGGDR